MQAIWNNQIIAVSVDTLEVEGNHYFPPESVMQEFLQPSATTTQCPWKGEAHYYSLEVDGDVHRDAAWYYPEPKQAAENIRGRIAFGKGVKVTDAV